MNTAILFTLFYHFITLSLSFITFYCTLKIIFNKYLLKKCSKFSPIMNLYFIFLFIWSILSTINCVYLIIFWRPEEYGYDARLLYAFSFLPYIMFYWGTYLDIILCADRCITVLFPVKYSSRFRSFYFYGALIGFIIFPVIFLWINPFLSAIPQSSISTCRFLNCFLSAYLLTTMLPTKLVLIGINFGFGCLLFVLTKVILSHENASIKKLHQRILLLILSTTLFEMFPHIVVQVVQWITPGMLLNQIIGPYSTPMSAFNLALCAAIYSRTFRYVYQPPNSIAPKRKICVISKII